MIVLSRVRRMSCTSVLSYLKRVRQMSNLNLDAGEDFLLREQRAEEERGKRWIGGSVDRWMNGSRAAGRKVLADRN